MIWTGVTTDLTGLEPMLCINIAEYFFLPASSNVTRSPSLSEYNVLSSVVVSKQHMEVRGSKMEYMSVNERVKKVEGRRVCEQDQNRWRTFSAVMFARGGPAGEERCRKRKRE